jgi:hypothetical protein
MDAALRLDPTHQHALIGATRQEWRLTPRASRRLDRFDPQRHLVPIVTPECETCGDDEHREAEVLKRG